MKDNGQTNVLQSVEHIFQRTVAPLFGGLHSARASPQKAPLGLTHIQEFLPVTKKYCQLHLFINNKLIKNRCD
jgi:hypothetical protein